MPVPTHGRARITAIERVSATQADVRVVLGAPVPLPLQPHFADPLRVSLWHDPDLTAGIQSGAWAELEVLIAPDHTLPYSDQLAAVQAQAAALLAQWQTSLGQAAYFVETAGREYRSDTGEWT